MVQWLFAIVILFGLGGYSNYTSPKVKDIATEQLISIRKQDKKSISYQNQLKKKWDSAIIESNISFVDLMVFHTGLTATKSKCYSISIPSSEKLHIALIHIASYTSEEDSFHFKLG